MTVNEINIPLDDLISLRKNLHRNAELSGSEFKSKQIIRDFISNFQPDEIIDNIGGTGLAIIYDSKRPGNTILFRADMDALPINEGKSISYASCNPGISHKCGHDGHSAILCGLACFLYQMQIPNGKIIFVFQPAEETGKGAKQILEDPLFKNISPDYVFALHNLPGFEKGSVIIKKEQFTSASKGMIIKLSGKVAHAAYPENGVSPAVAMAEIIQKFNDLALENDAFDNFVMITVIYASLGEKAFGTAPGYAEIMATLRSYDNKNMNRLTYECNLLSEEIAKQQGLDISVAWTDEFDETYNHSKAVNIIEQAAKSNNCKINRITYPFRWSEDFGRFTSKHKGAIFGLGAGTNHPALHSDEYDFPDDIIETGVNLFADICNIVLNESENNPHDNNRNYRHSRSRQGDDS